MAKITDLLVTTALTGDEHMPIVQGGETRRVTMAAFRALITPFLQNWYKGDRGDAGAANNTYTSYAALVASDPTRLYAYLSGDTDNPPQPDGPYSNPTGRPGAWVRQQAAGITHRLPDADAVTQDLGTGQNAMLFVSKFGVLAGLGDQTAALNRAIRAAAMRGGGELVFDAALAAYQVDGPVFLPSNVRLNLNGQRLNGKGAASYPDAMFVTGMLDSGVLASNLGSEAESKIVRYAGIRNGKITNAGRAFDFFNFVHGCRLENIATEDCRQVYRMERCFDCVVDQMTARGSSSPEIPTYHHIDQANGMIVSRLNATTAWGMHLEGGTNAFVLLNPVFEGGVIGLKITGDCLGLAVISPYFENIPGRAFDLRSAGAVVWTVSGMYASFVDIVLDDGGADGTATIGGHWSESNGIFNIGASIGPNLFRAQMRVSGPRNYCSYNALTTAVGGIGTQPHWIVSPLTNLTYDDVFGGFSATDIRARARHHVGVIPSLRTGDVGDPVINTIPYTTSYFPKGASVEVTIETDIVWRPITQHVEYALRIQDDENIYDICGDVRQSRTIPVPGSTDGKTVTATAYAKGGKDYLRLTIGNFNNTSGNGRRTGKVNIVP